MKNTLSLWLQKRGYTLFEGREDYYDPVIKKITYNKKLSSKNQIYSILHECGHLLVQMNGVEYGKRFKSQLEGLVDKRKCRSLRWRVDFLKEEYDAWDRGLELAKQLKLNIDYDKYYNYASKCLASYCKWVIDKEWHKYDY